jgi:glycine betaine/proline transport system substrate-binding protein
MDETIERYHRGEPVLFYTWTPNWTVGKLVPGKDVVWLQVPFASLPFEQQDLEERTFVEDVPG